MPQKTTAATTTHIAVRVHASWNLDVAMRTPSGVIVRSFLNRSHEIFTQGVKWIA